MDVKGRKAAARPVVGLAGLAVLCLLFLSLAGSPEEKQQDEQDTGAQAALGKELLAGLGEELAEALYRQFIPMFSFAKQDDGGNFWVLQKQVSSLMPFYRYVTEQGIPEEGQDTVPEEETLSLEEIMQAEAEECEMGTGEEQSLQELLQAENEAAMGTGDNISSKPQPETAVDTDSLPIENSVTTAGQFTPHGLQNPISLETVQNYETLIQDFYTIDANTMAGSDQLNADKLLARDMKLSGEGEGPQILIYHTHSQEAFADSVKGDAATSIVGAGDNLERILTEQYGYKVLHHEGEYDVDARDDAYSRSLPAIEKILAENPSIEVVIDLHRDQMAEETRLVMDLDGRPTARFMFFNGLSRTRKTGNISYLYNENQEENLAFSFQMQMAAMQYYPGLTRKVYLKGYRYNMHLRPKTLLVELGAQNNTVEEIMNACDPLAHILSLVLSGEAEGLSAN